MTDGFPAISYVPLAESAFLVRLGDGVEVDPSVVDAVVRLTRALDAEAIPGVTDIVPAYATILVSIDPVGFEWSEIASTIDVLVEGGIPKNEEAARTVIIPAAYGGKHGPDLADVSALVGIDQETIIEMHVGGEYRVACTGFSPGWAYLIGLAPELTVPRRENPRTRVPKGSVAIGGGQTGVYPLESPGGWHLIGRSPLSMFDPARDEPLMLAQGDRVKFARISDEQYEAMLATGSEL